MTEVDTDGIQAEDCAQVIRILSRASHLDRIAAPETVKLVQLSGESEILNDSITLKRA